MNQSDKSFNYNFRTLNYLGSKLRLLDFIQENIIKLTKSGEGICDLFAGSGCVSYKLSQKFSVVACDIQTYSGVICNALLKSYNVSTREIRDFNSFLYSDESNNLCDAFSPLIRIEEGAIEKKQTDVLTDIIEHGSVEVFALQNSISPIQRELEAVTNSLERLGKNNVLSLISRYYGGVYFSYRQAVCIDIILQAIHTRVSPSNKSIFLAALLSTASDIVDTVGKHFAQPLKARDYSGRIKATVYNKAIKDKTIDVFSLYEKWLSKYLTLPKASFTNYVLNTEYLDCLHNLPQNIQTIYADPPYTRDHYSRFYHVLETIALRDSPELSKVKKDGKVQISNGLYRKERYQSPFCIRSKAPEAFSEMFQYISENNKNLILSYSPYDESKKSHPRVVTMSQLLSLAEKYFKNVNTISAGRFSHNKLTSTDHFLEASDEAEVLIICSNNIK